MSTTDVENVLAAMAEKFGSVDFQPAPLMARADKSRQQMHVRVGPDMLLEVMRFLRHDDRCRFNQLCDLTCVDYLEFPAATERYGVTYSLLSTELNHRLWVKCFVNDPDPEVPSVTSIWKGADWPEREVWDLFGVRFSDHPDLRRIMTWEGYEGHPLRKDYPLHGRGEREDYRRVERESA